MKSFTDIEESKKLAEILPIESADMGWNVFVDGSVRCLPINDWDLNKDGSNSVKFIPTWSLGALLDYLAKKDCFPEVAYTGICYLMDVNFYDDEEGNLVHPIHFIRTEGESLVDACYEMILKLHEEKLL